MQDTTISIVPHRIESFKIIDEVKEKIYPESDACVRIKIILGPDLFNKNSGTIYARMDCKENGNIYVLDSLGKLAIMVDSIFINGKKVLKDTTSLNSLFFINDKISPERASNRAPNPSYHRESITLKEYVNQLRDDEMTMFHIEGDNVLVFTRWDDPVGGNADSQAEALYRQAKAAHVRNIKTVRIMKMPEKKVVGRYVSRK